MCKCVHVYTCVCEHACICVYVQCVGTVGMHFCVQSREMGNEVGNMGSD